MIVALVVAGVLAVVAIVLGVRLRASSAQVIALTDERARLAGSLAAREAELSALKPYREAVDGAADWIWTADGDGRITFSNPAGAVLLGYDDLVGRRLGELAPDGSDGWSGVVQRRHADGSLRTLDSRAARADDGWRGIDRDLTEAEPKRVAIVRRPVVDGRREVTGYELIGDGSVLQSYAPSELIALAGARTLWLSLDGEVAPELAASGTVVQVRPGADLGLSVALLRHVNSAFFALPRQIDTVREALTLLGSRAVRRWATVVALSSVTHSSDQLVALALLRARMCELLGGAEDEAERDRLFTAGLFSAADALLDAPMEEVLASLPLSEETKGVLLRHEGRRGRVLSTVLRYEQGHFPSDAGGDPGELAEAYLAALRWADDAGSWLG